MSTKLNPNAILDRSITAIKLSNKYVTAPSNSTTNGIALFANASGGAIKDSGLTYGTGNIATTKVLSTNTDNEEDLIIKAYSEVELTTTNYSGSLVVGESIEMDAPTINIGTPYEEGIKTSSPDIYTVALSKNEKIRNYHLENDGASVEFNVNNGGIHMSTEGNGYWLSILNNGVIDICAGDMQIAATVKIDDNCYANAFYETSDENLKDFSGDVDVNFAKLKEIRKSYFTWKDGDGKTQIGTSAQDVQKVYPELVSEDNKGNLTVDYAKLSIIALSAIDKLDERLSKIEKTLNITE
jgi:hypothetical protein